MRPWAFITQGIAAERYGKFIPFLEKGDFGFVNNPDFCIPGSLALCGVYQLRFEGFGVSEAAWQSIATVCDSLKQVAFTGVTFIRKATYFAHFESITPLRCAGKLN